MKGHFLVAIALMSTSASGAEPLVFHTSTFADSATVDFSLLSNRLSTDAGYDFDVSIGLTETMADDASRYSDRSAHRARVRCARPATIFVGGARYQVDPGRSADDADGWKTDLWKAVCGVPVS